jgi:hypothetical protein
MADPTNTPDPNPTASNTPPPASPTPGTPTPSAKIVNTALEKKIDELTLRVNSHDEKLSTVDKIFQTIDRLSTPASQSDAVREGFFDRLKKSFFGEGS